MRSKGLMGVLIPLILVLSMLGVAYSAWRESVTITASVSTGEVDVAFTGAFTNDDGVVDDSTKDPDDDGTDPGKDKDVASSSASCDGKTGSVTISNAYPCYETTAWFELTNTGTIPVKVEKVEISLDGTTWTEISPCTIYYIDIETGNIDDTLDPGDDLSIHVTPSDLLGTQIDDGDSLQLDLTIHVEQDASENGSYTVYIRITVVQWNEY